MAVETVTLRTQTLLIFFYQFIYYIKESFVYMYVFIPDVRLVPAETRGKFQIH